MNQTNKIAEIMSIIILKTGSKFENTNTHSIITITNVTEKRVSFAVSDFKSYKANVNTMSTLWISMKQALKFIENGNWKIQQ